MTTDLAARAEASWWRWAHATNRATTRRRQTRGDHHIERVIGQILAGDPGRDPAVRLLAASDLAQVMDGAR